MKQKIISLIISIVAIVVLAAVGINAINGIVTIEHKESSFKLTAFDYVIKSPLRSQIQALEENTEAVASTFACTELRAIVSSASSSPELILLASENIDNYGIGLFCDATLVEGEFNREGIMLDETAAEKLKVTVGDEVSFSAKGMPVTLTVSAIYRASTYKTLEKGIGLIALTEAMKAAYGKELPHSICFIDANDEAKCAAALATYKPLAQLKTEEQFTADYKEKYEPRPGATEEEWAETIHAAYEEYFNEGVAMLDTKGSVERKSEMMEDIADRVATAKNDVDVLTIGIAIASAVAYSVLAVVILYSGMKDDIIRATQGLKKSRLVNENLITHAGMSVIVALVAFAILYAVADAKGYVNAAMPAIMLCSLPVLVAVPVSCFAAFKYANDVYGKASEGEDDAVFMKPADGDFDFTFVRPVYAPVSDADARDEASRIVINIGGSGTQPQNNGESAEGENADTVAESDMANTECGEAQSESSAAPADNGAQTATVQDNTQTERRTQRIELDIGDDYVPIKRNVRPDED